MHVNISSTLSYLSSILSDVGTPTFIAVMKITQGGYRPRHQRCRFEDARGLRPWLHTVIVPRCQSAALYGCDTTERCAYHCFVRVTVKYFNPLTNVVLLRISRDHYETMWSAMSFITQMNQRECCFRVIHLAGGCLFTQCIGIVVHY